MTKPVVATKGKLSKPEIVKKGGGGGRVEKKTAKPAKDIKPPTKDVKAHSKASGPILVCEPCKQEFLHEWSYMRHVDTVHKKEGTKKLKCKVCAKDFSRPDNLKTHMKIHSKAL